jgi:two-component system, OmpR family, sensor histidine kinase CiaH
VFRSARLKLTLVYTLAIALVMAVFSIALYFAIASAISGNFEVPDTLSAQAEHALLEAQLARARWVLLGINLAGWVVAAVASYVFAGRTLAPLEAAMARQRQFTAHASHELRTPLTVIKGEIDVTRARERSPELYRETLDRIDAEVMHLESVVGDLLALARMEAGRDYAERRRGNVAAAVNEVLEPFHGPLADGEIALEAAVPPQLEATLDWPRIRHLLTNLIDNAVLHTSPGGRIRIAAGQHGRYLDLEVFNSGAPIDPNDLPHLFVPFYRGKESPSYNGTGLGLALSDWIVRTHHGSIIARNLDGGVSFDVRLPRD